MFKIFILAILTIPTITQAQLSEEYSNFYFEAKGNCSSPEEMTFRKLVSRGSTSTLGTTADGHKILAQVVLSIIKNQAYTLMYKEYYVKEIEGQETEFVVIHEQNLKGTWYSNNYGPYDQLTFTDQDNNGVFGMTPSPFTIGGVKTVMFMILKSLNREIPEGYYMILAPQDFEHAAYMESAQEYCQSPY